MAIYHEIGGMETCRRLAIRRLAMSFYARVEKDKVLRPLYPRSLHAPSNPSPSSWPRVRHT